MKPNTSILILLYFFLSINHIDAINLSNSSDSSSLNVLCPAPILTSYQPSSGPENTLITIQGSDFDTAASVTFDGTEASFTIINANEITALVPAGIAETSTISITSTGGCTGDAATNFTFISSECFTGELYISEIFDSETGSYGIIELYNPTNTTITLDGIYTVERYGDIGNAAPSITIPLVNTVGPQQTYNIQLGNTGTDCGIATDLETATGFNENDEFKLLKNNVLIDIVHAPDEKGYTIIRNANAVAPSNTFNATEWLIDSFEMCTDLGMHTADPTSSETPEIIHPMSQNMCANDPTSFTVSVDSGTFSYQWKTLDASGNWVNVTNNAIYSGATTNTLNLINVPITFNGNQYYCEITSANCELASNAAQLFVFTSEVDDLADANVCENYTLPDLTNGNYFTLANGSGTQLNAGDVITTTQTIFIFNSVGTCTNESSFTVTITDPPAVDTIEDQTVCTEYILPTLINGTYFPEANGTGTTLNAGDVISSTQTIYIYNETGVAPDICSNESSFTVTISGTPTVDILNDDTACSEFTLPALINGNYFTASGGNGTSLNAGDVITTSQRIYIYIEIGTAPDTCSNESSFDITINQVPIVDIISSQDICSDYTLPMLTNGNYFTSTNGAGTQLNAGDLISASQTIYIYNEIGTSPNICSNESSFDITIYPAVDFSLTESNITIDEDSITVTMTDNTIPYEYAIDNGVFQSDFMFTNLSNGQHTLYVSDNNGCVTKSLTFDISVDLGELIIPEGFSPNNDGKNDWFNIQGLYDNYQNHELKIYNRYGALIFEGNNNNKWYGIANKGLMKTSNVLPVGTYFYVLNLNDTNATKNEYIGWVYLNK
ncbi:T9SS type B sorting domain-containing protein [Psychroserpens ponticola]|uniref:Gliding motility-associated C-terminal domain-containing protein n=1 Tax=Psychroserpens ponticola TaxID=2932268 RepID=A0ABY7S4B4_9FLAO|nr:gliding motility-associated C-terminal domain-containing protein [Psychroserpens ponticola]WCO02745.1 gliding motility-associated C-terminal domain-containing protein [Psychroserpens ponticola]